MIMFVAYIDIYTPTMKPYVPLRYDEDYIYIRPPCAKKHQFTYLRFLYGDLDSAVGTTCSPGRTHKIGPSLLLFRSDKLSAEKLPHGIVSFRNRHCSRRSRNFGKYPPLSSCTVPTRLNCSKGPDRYVP